MTCAWWCRTARGRSIRPCAPAARRTWRRCAGACRRCTTARCWPWPRIERRDRARAAGGLLRHGGHGRRAGGRRRAARAGGGAGRRRPAAPRRRRVAALGLSVATVLPDGRVLLGRRRAELPLDPGAWHVVPSGMLEPEPDPVGAAVAREGREELGVDVDRGAVRVLGLGWDLARLRPEVCLALALDEVPARAGGDEFEVVEAFDVRGAAPLTPGAACALALLANARVARVLGPSIDVNEGWPREAAWPVARTRPSWPRTGGDREVRRASAPQGRPHARPHAVTARRLVHEPAAALTSRGWPGAEVRERRVYVSCADARALAGPGATFAWWSRSTPNSARSASRWPPSAGGRPTAPSRCWPGSARRARRSCSSVRSTTSTRASRSPCRAAGSAIRATAGASWPSARGSRSPPASRRCSPTWARSSTSGRAARQWLLERHGPEQVLAAIDRDPERALREVPGIGRARIGAAVRSWEDQGALRAVRAVPRGARRPRRGGRAHLPRLRPGAIETLRSDPYGLTELDGIGFATADALAQALGTPPDSPGRLDAGLRHALHEAESDGHCHLPRAELAERARRLLGADADDRIDELAARGELVDRGRPRLRPRRCMRIETRLARHVRALIDDEPRLRLGAIERPTGDLRPDRRPVGGGPRRARAPAVDPHRRPGHRQDRDDARARRPPARAEAHRAPVRADGQGGAPAGRDRPARQATTIHRLLEYDARRGLRAAAPTTRSPAPTCSSSTRPRCCRSAWPRRCSAPSGRARTCCSWATSTSSRRSARAACSTTSSSRAPCRSCG